MRALPAHIESVIASDAITLATCWRLTLENGSILRFTDHHSDIVIGSETFLAGGSFSRSAIAFGLGLGDDNFDIEGTVGDDSITETDLIAGLYDHADLEIFLVDYLAPNSGIFELCSGRLGEVEISDSGFGVEVLGLASQLKQADTDLCSPTCRANLGDSKCGVNMTSHTQTGTVTSVTSALVFDTNLTPTLNRYAGGAIEFTSGNNSGLILEVKSSNTTGLIELFLPSPYAVQPGDTFTIKRGCNKTQAVCRDTYNNIINFRGEPFVPGSDKILQINNAKPTTTV